MLLDTWEGKISAWIVNWTNYILRNNEALAEKGEFSILNSTHANLLNQSSSRMLLNKSVFSNRTLVMESMNEGNNILDELNCEKNKFSQQKLGLKEMIKNITL